MRRKGSLVEMLEKVARREVDVLIGTQMIAKGHDFPECTLVGVISADVGLGMADFRSAERTFQLLTQVAGRAGRGERPGQAIIQSLVPEHYSVRLACDQDYRAFYEKEVAFRRAMRYPPQVAMVNVVVRDKTFESAMATARDLANGLRGASGFVVLGPGARSAHQATRRTPGPIVPEGHQPQGDAREPAVIAVAFAQGDQGRGCRCRSVVDAVTRARR